jgi:magnesium transporter
MALLVLASSVIVENKEIIERHAILAAFLTVVAGLSGNSGNQAMAVSIRELTLGLIRPSEMMVVFLKEVFLGIVVGLILGLLLGILAFLFSHDLRLSGVVAIALSTNTVISVIVGGIVPLFLRKVGFDPALASGPILTTTVDMCGFFLVLSLAHWFLG